MIDVLRTEVMYDQDRDVSATGTPTADQETRYSKATGPTRA
ncbi:hypothetical protein JJ691_19180 [Kutzneria sp. CA-103260]|nr:hypothetical protein JJ691_19180 [Kutzneria sp. CA-103260]